MNKPPFNSLQAWLTWIEQQHPTTIDLGLERILNAATPTALNQFSCPVIIVSGTNGKGSTVTLLETIYRQAGYQTGVYLSPHLCRYNERIRINGHDIADAALSAAFAHVNAIRGDISLSYFEWGTLAALYLFQQQPLDVIILEVGLGGRLDAVNIVDSDLAIITSIAMDHMEYLGTTRASIAYEKAGIMRSGKPVICGDPDPPLPLSQQAKALKAPLLVQGVDFCYCPSTQTWSWQCHNMTWDNLPLPHFLLQNAATVLMAIHVLSTKLPVSREAINNGLLQARLPGRYQLISQHPRCIVDVAHNPASAHALVQRLQQEKSVGQFRAVVGMLVDKDIQQTLMPFKDLINQWYLATLPPPRGAKVNHLANVVALMGRDNYQCFEGVEAAFLQAKQEAAADDLIVVFGSFHTVGAVLGGQGESPLF